jgi:hypothetical protein
VKGRCQAVISRAMIASDGGDTRCERGVWRSTVLIERRRRVQSEGETGRKPPAPRGVFPQGRRRPEQLWILRGRVASISRISLCRACGEEMREIDRDPVKIPRYGTLGRRRKPGGSAFVAA